jgi:hypothetical protein
LQIGSPFPQYQTLQYLRDFPPENGTLYLYMKLNLPNNSFGFLIEFIFAVILMACITKQKYIDLLKSFTSFRSAWSEFILIKLIISTVWSLDLALIRKRKQPKQRSTSPQKVVLSASIRPK